MLNFIPTTANSITPSPLVLEGSVLVEHEGAWKPPTDFYVEVNGVWKQAVAVWAADNVLEPADWRSVWETAGTPIP